MKPGDVMNFETTYVMNPDPQEPIMRVGGIITVGPDMVPYRVTEYVNGQGVQMFQLMPVQASAQGDGAGE